MNNWKTEFKKKFGGYIGTRNRLEYLKIEAFIEELLEKQRKETKKEISEIWTDELTGVRDMTDLNDALDRINTRYVLLKQSPKEDNIEESTKGGELK